MSAFPCLVRSSSAGGEFRYALGDRLVDSYLVICGEKWNAGSRGGRTPSEVPLGLPQTRFDPGHLRSTAIAPAVSPTGRLASSVLWSA